MYSQESLTLPKDDVTETEDSKKSKVNAKKEKKMTFYQKHKAMMEKRERENLVATGKKILRPGVVSMCYYEELDLLISGYEDCKIREFAWGFRLSHDVKLGIWGYNEETIVYIPDPAKAAGEPDAAAAQNETNVNSRVAGMSLKATFKEHKDAVVALTCIKQDDRHVLVYKLSLIRSDI